ncbi:MAG: nitrilase-related carbon-nitrogen hydrolase [Luteolibacter sp.]
MKIPRNLPARCALAVISGLSYALAFPPLGWRWLILPGIAGLLVSLHGQTGTRARMIGFLHGLAVFAVSLSWIWNIFGSMSIALWIVLAAFTALFAEMQGRAQKRGLVGWKFAAFTALNWGAWEFIRAEIFPLKFPWMTAGLAVGPNLFLPWIGVYCVGLVVVFSAAAVTTRSWKSAAASLAILLAAVFLSRPHAALKPGDAGVVSMGGVQLENVTIDDYLKATAAMPADVQYVVWPEYAIAYDIRKNDRDWMLLQDLCEERDITLTFGTRHGTESEYEGWRNIALTMDRSGYLGEHNKVHTVHFFDDGVPGKIFNPVATQHGRVGTPICFDADYQDVIRAMTALGAEFIVIPTMDAESWSARQHDQHAELARIRAAENGRWIFVAATSGVSQVIDPRGHLHARLGALEQGTILGLIKRETGRTAFTRVGWMLPWGLLGIAAVWWVYLLFPQRKAAS